MKEDGSKNARSESKLKWGAEAIGAIAEGAKVLAGRVHLSNTPMALVHELLRQRAR